MCANSSSARCRGFTTIELVAVIVLMGVLAVVALPRMEGALAQRGDHWRDQGLAEPRHPQAPAPNPPRLARAPGGTERGTRGTAPPKPDQAPPPSP